MSLAHTHARKTRPHVIIESKRAGVLVSGTRSTLQRKPSECVFFVNGYKLTCRRKPVSGFGAVARQPLVPPSARVRSRYSHICKSFINYYWVHWGEDMRYLVVEITKYWKSMIETDINKQNNSLDWLRIGDCCTLISNPSPTMVLGGGPGMAYSINNHTQANYIFRKIICLACAFLLSTNS